MRRFFLLLLLLSLVMVLFVSCQPFDRIGYRTKDHYKEAPVVSPIAPEHMATAKVEPREPIKNPAPAPDLHKDNPVPHRR